MRGKPIVTYRLGEDFYGRLEALAKNLTDKGLELFKEEFGHIDAFYEKALDDQSSRDDHDFRRQPRLIYLLEAINFKIYDQLNRESFNTAKDTVIIFPQCLALMQSKCKRKGGKYGKQCAKCVPNCQIRQITEMAQRYGVEAYFSKRKLEQQLTKIKKDKPSLSVIGISCILTLAGGMRTAKDVGIPARGALLNFTGCDHWSEVPFSTETAIGRVCEILEEKYGLSNPTP